MSIPDQFRAARARHRGLRSIPSDSRSVAPFLLAFACGASGAVALAAWRVLVPAVLSEAAFVWLVGLTILMMLMSGVMAARARATQSIAHVLYDTEHPAARSR